MEKKTTAQKKIKEALVVLIEEKGLDSVTVADLARKAGINRGTFYLHYLDKYDLVEKIEHELTDTIISSVNNSLLLHTSFAIKELSPDYTIEDQKEAFAVYMPTAVMILSYLYEERRIISALISDKGDPAFLNAFKKLFLQTTMREITFYHNIYPSNLGIPDDYLEEMVLGSMVAAVLHWLSKGAIEPVEKIASLLLGVFFIIK